ncbi:polysaccharide pyruvyl transferase family protein [Streptomyces sp. TRM66268-LWL]|uniref:Polysaccharide pyruvyl transferase family protein n=1 Tax=Streptomyces polyasparticus TaxID=2767826 RepID=A0ABR7SY98_9ACTN|nr:polysaccharide pyruvyl transferase family protein [Streptomyces polyasparticus]MBC9719531.1 polysaccharide pyruvyl transferase family protein [Streptomyces polyasparticus]
MNIRRHIIYLGWQGFQNFGDDLLYATWKVALGTPLRIQAPLTRRDYAAAAPRFFSQRVRTLSGERLVLLGGGTTVGFASWGAHARNAMTYYDAHALVVAGAGAASSDDTFALGLQRTDWAQWGALPNVALFGVRGPLTSEECQRHWRPAPVIGDPALLYTRYAMPLPTPAARPVVGVCLGASPVSRFSVEVVADAIRIYLAAHPGTTVRVVQLSPEDAGAAHNLVKALGNGTSAEIVAYSGDVHGMMQAIAGCSLLLSERLHGTVAGVACGIPTVPLAYASKCDDFWLSVSGERPALGVTANSHLIADELEKATEPGRIFSVASRTTALQDRLESAAEQLRRWHAGQQPAVGLGRYTERAEA